MKRIHPNSSHVITCAFVAAFVAAGGCRSSSTSVTNPFLAPDRVAPPSTRVIAPGQAQPYYQGDPLPVMQSATAPPANIQVASNNPAEALSSSGRTLGWNAPGAAAPTAAPAAALAANTASPWDANQSSKPPVSYGKEGAVSVPADTGALRFPPPAPAPPVEPAPIAPAPPANAQPIQPAAAPPNQGVQLASFNAPAPGAPAPAPVSPVASPWQTPQAPPASPAPLYGVQASPYQPVVVQPVPYSVPTNQMAVELRSVPSPPPQPGDPMPRIRMPGYEVPQTATYDGFRPHQHAVNV